MKENRGLKRYVLISTLTSTKIIDTEVEGNFRTRKPKYYIIDGFLYSREVNVYNEPSHELYQLGKVEKTFDEI